MVIYRHKDKYSISELCRFFGVSRSGYYGYVSRMDIPAWDLPLAEKYENVKKSVEEHMDIVEYISGSKDKEYIHLYINERIELKTKLTPQEMRCQYVA